MTLNFNFTSASGYRPGNPMDYDNAYLWAAGMGFERHQLRQHANDLLAENDRRRAHLKEYEAKQRVLCSTIRTLEHNYDEVNLMRENAETQLAAAREHLEIVRAEREEAKKHVNDLLAETKKLIASNEALARDNDAVHAAATKWMGLHQQASRERVSLTYLLAESRREAGELETRAQHVETQLAAERKLIASNEAVAPPAWTPCCPSSGTPVVTPAYLESVLAENAALRGETGGTVGHTVVCGQGKRPIDLEDLVKELEDSKQTNAILKRRLGEYNTLTRNLRGAIDAAGILP
jgi:DNA repair exonuclease SbcCD ATPase subunit